MRLTLGTIAFGDVALDSKDRAGLGREPLPLHEDIRRQELLDAAAGLQIGDPGLQAELAIIEHAGHSEAGHAKGTHRPVEIRDPRAASLVAELPRHRRLQARRPFGRRHRRPGLGGSHRVVGLHRRRCRTHARTHGQTVVPGYRKLGGRGYALRSVPKRRGAS